MGRELLLGFLNLSICPKKFPAGCEHSRLDPKPIFNQVPVLCMPLFQIYPCLKKAFKGLRLKLSVNIKNICPSMKIFFQIEKRNDIDIFRVKLENSFGCWQNTVWRMGVTGNTVIITSARWIWYLVLLQMKSINKMYFCLRELYYEENFIGLLFPV